MFLLFNFYRFFVPQHPRASSVCKKLKFASFCIGLICVGGFIYYINEKTRYMSERDRTAYIKSTTGIAIAVAVVVALFV